MRVRLTVLWTTGSIVDANNKHQDFNRLAEITMSSHRLAAVIAAVLLGTAGIASGQPPANQASIPDTPGTGPFPPIKEIDPRLPDQVVYRPADLESLGDTKLGVYVFGNGGCSNDGPSRRLHRLHIESHRYLDNTPGR